MNIILFKLLKQNKASRCRKSLAFVTACTFMVCSVMSCSFTVNSYADDLDEEVQEFVPEIDENVVPSETIVDEALENILNNAEDMIEAPDDSEGLEDVVSETEADSEFDNAIIEETETEKSGEEEILEPKETEIEDTTDASVTDIEEAINEETDSLDTVVGEDESPQEEIKIENESFDGNETPADNEIENSETSDTEIDVDVLLPEGEEETTDEVSEDATDDFSINDDINIREEDESPDEIIIVIPVEKELDDENKDETDIEEEDALESEPAECENCEIKVNYIGFKHVNGIYSGNVDSAISITSDIPINLSVSAGGIITHEPDGSISWHPVNECYGEVSLALSDEDGVEIAKLTPNMVIDYTPVEISIDSFFDNEGYFSYSAMIAECGAIQTGIRDLRVLVDGKVINELNITDCITSVNEMDQEIVVFEKLLLERVAFGAHEITLLVTDNAGNVSVHTDNVTVPALLRMDTPSIVNLTIDPWRINGGYTIFSDIFAIRNNSQCDVAASLLNIKYYVNNEINPVLAEKNGVDADVVKDAKLYLKLIDTDEIFELSDEGSYAELADISALNESGTNYISFVLLGEISEGSEGLWEDGDIKLSLSFDYEPVYDEEGELILSTYTSDLVNEIIEATSSPIITEEYFYEDWTRLEDAIDKELTGDLETVPDATIDVEMGDAIIGVLKTSEEEEEESDEDLDEDSKEDQEEEIEEVIEEPEISELEVVPEIIEPSESSIIDELIADGIEFEEVG